MFEVDHWSHCEREHEYAAMFAQYVRDIDSYALVYSTTSRASFDSMRAWHNTICTLQKTTTPARWPEDRVKPRPPAMLVAVIATKCDLQDQREVSITEGIELARELGCPFYQTSAVTRHNVDRVFEAMGRTWRDRDTVQAQSAAEIPLQTGSEIANEGRRRSSVHRRLSSIHRKLVGSSKE
jgi:GTPase KRas protein